MHTKKGREVVYTGEKIRIPREQKIQSTKVTMLVTEYQGDPAYRNTSIKTENWGQRESSALKKT